VVYLVRALEPVRDSYQVVMVSDLGAAVADQVDRMVSLAAHLVYRSTRAG
jgi:hypothetical protein